MVFSLDIVHYTFISSCTFCLLAWFSYIPRILSALPYSLNASLAIIRAQKSMSAVFKEHLIEDADSALVQYNENPVSNIHKVNDSTTAGRDAFWGSWTLWVSQILYISLSILSLLLICLPFFLPLTYAVLDFAHF
jgi:hypothetical protein